MVSKVSSGVRISVETFYQPEYSNTGNSEYMFAYRITIENNNPFPVKLISRHWYIFDSVGTIREVEGEGVVGIQPMIKPNEKYQYMSGCNLSSEIGRMHGTYLFVNMFTQKEFTGHIPAFEMFVPAKLN